MNQVYEVLLQKIPEAGVEIGEGGDPKLRRNRINGDGSAGVYVSDGGGGGGGGGAVEDDLRDNAQGAWYVSEDSEQNLKRASNEV